MKMRIEVPQLPPVEYSGNSRAHWAKQYQAGRVYQAAVFYCCVDARNRALMEGTNYLFIKPRLNLTFIFPSARRRDEDNLRARFKPGLDAIVDAGLLLDDDVEHVQLGKVDILVDPGRAPLTIIELELEEN